MILIVTHKKDLTADYIVSRFNNLGVRYLRLNTEEIGTRHTISVDYSNQNQITLIDGISFFNSVWFRRTAVPNYEFHDSYQKDYYIKDFKHFLDFFWQGVRTDRWLNHPDLCYRAENKLLQLTTAQRVDLSIPETIIVSNKSRLQEFYKRHNEKVILKPICDGRYLDVKGQELIFTNQLKKEHLTQDDSTIFPIIFQEDIKKEYELRITVVDGKVFSAKVDSQSSEKTKTDWRRGQLKFQPYLLPLDIQKKSIKLMNLLGLKFGAIDLVKTRNDYVFLEINPIGQWVWIEYHTGLKISDRIIKYLTCQP